MTIENTSTSIAEIEKMLAEAKQAHEASKQVIAPKPVLPMGTIHEMRTAEPSMEEARFESSFNPKDCLEQAFVAGRQKTIAYLKLSKWFMQKGYKRDGQDLNVWDYLGSLYSQYGWPESNGRYVSVDTAKKTMGNHHPAILYIQAYKQWTSNHFLAGCWSEKVKPVAVAPIKTPDVLQSLVNANKDGQTPVSEADKIAAHNLEVISNMNLREAVKPLDDSKPVTKSVTQEYTGIGKDGLQVVVPPIELNKLQAMQKIVLKDIIVGKNSDKAKRLAMELMSELGIA